MRGVLLIPSSSPTLSPVYDGLDVNVISNITWFRLNHDTVHVESLNYPSTEGTPLHEATLNSRRCRSPDNQRMLTKYPELERGSKIRLFETNENEAIV